MISDEQRRMVAKELRSESESWRDTFPEATLEEEAIGASVMSDLMVFVELDDQSPVHEVYTRLAELIDRPTCKNLATKPADELLCSEFDVKRGLRNADGTDDHHARYCPNCGRGIVE